MTLHHGDCIEVMRGMPADSIDSIVTDPPYGLGFMGKKWDALPPGEEWARECLRVLKPGGHILAFGGSRTWHRLAVAIEDGGFEIRDSIAWLYGSGFPKSLDVSKAIDKAAGAERKVVGMKRHARDGDVSHQAWAANGNSAGEYVGGGKTLGAGLETAPATDEARKWAGWGTALKPAFEPVVMGRKPFTETVAANVMTHGTGALNIDATRHGERWPANVILDEWQAEALVEPKYFYVAKAPKSERPVVDGVAHPTVKPLTLMRHLVRLVTPEGGTVLDPFTGSGTTLEAAALEGLAFVGIEAEADYLPLIEARLNRCAA